MTRKISSTGVEPPSGAPGDVHPENQQELVSAAYESFDLPEDTSEDIQDVKGRELFRAVVLLFAVLVGVLFIVVVLVPVVVSVIEYSNLLSHFNFPNIYGPSAEADLKKMLELLDAIRKGTVSAAVSSVTPVLSILITALLTALGYLVGLRQGKK